MPKIELLARDRRSGAYPTKARTGDKTRTGKNSFYFDDTRTIVFTTNTTINLPTTFHTGSAHLASDTTGDFSVIGDVKEHAIDQWIEHQDLSERPGPFIEHFQYEQDENGIVNSTFLTGVAFNIAPDRFKSKLSDKTIIRIEMPLASISTLSPLTSSIYYLNTVTGKFDQVANEISRLAYGGGRFPTSFAPILFTPYGMHFLPIRHIPFSVQRSELEAKKTYGNIPGYAGDGFDEAFWPSSLVQTFDATASLINSRHKANNSQSIKLSQYLTHPFLLEKAIVELPFEAGPGWLNDRFGHRATLTDPNILDVSGPMITFALLRQDKNLQGNRDLIASGTVTNMLDMMTGTYHIMSTSNGGLSQITITPEGVGHFINPSVIITGSDSPSGSNNFFTGSIKFIMEPSVTAHVYRMRLSGSAIWHYYTSSPLNADGGKAKETEALGMAWSPTSKRTGLIIQTSRNVFGNHFASVEKSDLDGTLTRVKVIDTQYENLPQTGGGVGPLRGKLYTDVKSKTSKSPYLLYPEDDLIFAINKHRAVGSPLASDWTFNSPTFTYRTPLATVSSHDVSIPTGTLRITLYGDLIKEDREFHDTLNQRLETVELWETIGEEPVLDQFDVVYNSELSGSYLDRFSVLKALSPIKTDFSGSRFTDRYYSNFTSSPLAAITSWSEQYNWSKTKKIHEIQKSSRSPVHVASNEIFWDTRIPHPKECMTICNPNFRLTGYDSTASYWWVLYTGNTFYANDPLLYAETGYGIDDWGMTYPYESRYSKTTQIFANTLKSDVFRVKYSGAASIYLQTTPYDQITMEVGSQGNSDGNGFGRIIGAEYDSSINLAIGLRLAEFVKAFYGIGNGVSPIDNQHVTFRTFENTVGHGVELRGWRYGMMSGYPTANIAIFRRNRFGNFRDMLEQRLDAKFYDYQEPVGVRESPVEVNFYDREGNITSPNLTLSSNLSYEATSSLPYTDGLARNRSDIDYSSLNISTVVL